MTRVFNDPADFREEALTGFAAAYSRYVERVPGASGLVRVSAPAEARVSLVVGGGSGHYPSYAGIVGSGLADACVLGDVFTSPSSEQVYRVARAADCGAGVVLAFGNYAGDRLNFAAARERLVADGIDTRIVYVTDDIASAPPEDADLRRGIAGTVVVYKVGGAAADRGDSLDDVERLMRAANAATFSFGVAFAGCTLPGRREPLFRVGPDRVELGLGIHGEPGIESVPSMTARELAATLVDALLAERPSGAGTRAAVVLNGLGGTKYEELFVLYGAVHELLAAAGIEPVLPEVGELVTSLDMAGCSLSVSWLDHELEACWTAPADTAAFRRDLPRAGKSRARRRDLSERAAGGPVASAATDASRAAVPAIRAALSAMVVAMRANEDELGRLDAVAGDGDHGGGMVRGSRAAAVAAADADGGAGSVLAAAADAFSDRAGGTSGILWGILLAAVGGSLGDTEAVTPSRLAAAVAKGADTVRIVGGADVGDKTMLDALIPFARAFSQRLEAREGLAVAWSGAAAVAVESADHTSDLIARVGRARPLAERGRGTPDPGATSMALALVAVGEVLASGPSGS